MISVRGVDSFPRLAAVDGTIEARVGNIQGAHVFWIGPDVCEIPGALAEAVVIGDQSPVRAAVVATVKPAFLGFDERINDVRIGAGNGHANSAERPLRNAISFDALPS